MYLTSHCSGTRDPAHREAWSPKGRVGICKNPHHITNIEERKRKKRERFEGQYHTQVKHGSPHFKM